MKTYIFTDPNTSIVITVSAETEENALDEIDNLDVNNLKLEEEEEEDD